MSENKQNKKKPFSHPRWHEPIGGKVVGSRTMTPEEEKQAHEDTLAIAKSMGIKIKESK